jgi:hypothetical protein
MAVLGVYAEVEEESPIIFWPFEAPSTSSFFIQDLQEFCDSAFRNTFLLSVNWPASAKVS